MAASETTTSVTSTITGLPRSLGRALEVYADRLDIPAITNAYELAVEAHTGQTRESGEEYVSHPTEVATILAQLKLDSDCVIAGLIHDAVEDTSISLGNVENRFGKSVATIVDGVTKLGRVRFRSASRKTSGELSKDASLYGTGCTGNPGKAGRPASQHENARASGRGPSP